MPRRPSRHGGPTAGWVLVAAAMALTACATGHPVPPAYTQAELAERCVRTGAGQPRPSSERRHHFARRIHHDIPDGVLARCGARLSDVGRDVQPDLSALEIPPSECRDA